MLTLYRVINFSAHSEACLLYDLANTYKPSTFSVSSYMRTWIQRMYDSEYKTQLQF